MNLPNFLSLARIALVPLFIYLVVLPVEYKTAREWALVVYVIATVTDALDGYFARKFDQITSFGEVIDPIADKLLILTGLIALYITPQPVVQPPLWVTLIIYLREMVFIGGVITFLALKKKMPAKPNLTGKLTTLLQILLVGSCLLAFEISGIIAIVTAVVTLISGFVYTQRGSITLAGKTV